MNLIPSSLILVYPIICIYPISLIYITLYVSIFKILHDNMVDLIPSSLILFTLITIISSSSSPSLSTNRTVIQSGTKTTLESNRGCPLGTRKINNKTANTFHCKCLVHRKRHHEIYYQCRDNDDDNSGSGQNATVAIMDGRWWAFYLGQGVTLPCPFGYCHCDEKKIPSSFETPGYCPFDAFMCSEGRTGRLCSQCVEGYSVTFGSEQCMRCKESNQKFAIPLIFLLCIPLLAGLLIFFNIGAFPGYLNAFLFSYQIMSTILPKNLISKIDKGSLFLIYFFGLQGTGSNLSLCFYDGMDNLDKIALNYAIPTYMLLFTWCVGYLPERFWRWLSRGRDEPRQISIGRALGLIILICYFLVTTTTLDLLDRVTINDEEYVYKAAFTPYLTGKHIPLFILALLFLLSVVIFFPILLTFTPFFAKRLPVVKMHRMEPIFNTLKDCFRLRHRWFASFYFVCRLLVFWFAIWIKFEVDRSYVLALLCTTFFLVFASVQPYRSKSYNVWDMIQLTNLVILCVTALLLQTPFALRVKSQRKALTGIKICIYIPLVVLLLRIGWFLAIHKIKKIPWCEYYYTN